MKQSRPHRDVAFPGIHLHPVKKAFTLIELLVVISIIALLIGILLPALGTARQTARTAVCLSNLRSAGQAMATYTVDSRDYLAGPNTSGFQQSLTNTASTRQTPSEPTQGTDWVSPTLGRSLSLPADACERLEAIFKEEFRCPENDAFYTGAVGHTCSFVPTEMPVSSYSAALAFHYVTKQQHGPIWMGDDRGVISAFADLPKNYGPRIDRVGSASEKVYVMDGARHTTGPNDITFNGFIKQIQGGNFMSAGPWKFESGDPYPRDADGQPAQNAKAYAYRHHDQLNAVYFDGHARTEPDDEVVDFKKYLPSGSNMKNAAFTYYPEGDNGIIP